jgi:hypothetical protein
MFDFRFNTPAPFPESGSRKRFHASGIDFSHKITPRNVFFTTIFKQIFSENGLRLLPPLKKLGFHLGTPSPTCFYCNTFYTYHKIWMWLGILFIYTKNLIFKRRRIFSISFIP